MARAMPPMNLFQLSSLQRKLPTPHTAAMIWPENSSNGSSSSVFAHPSDDVLHHAQRTDDRTVHPSEDKCHQHEDPHNTTFNARSAGRNCILAVQPNQVCSVPVKSRNSNVTVAKHRTASVNLILRSILLNCFYEIYTLTKSLRSPLFVQTIIQAIALVRDFLYRYNGK